MVNGTKNAGLGVALSDGKHEWSAGLNAAAGGRDEAPDPHRLLEGALAACTALTVQLYANRKGWPLEGSKVKVEITGEGPVKNSVRRELSFHGPLSDEQRARLREIAEKCPIHRFLERPTEIETTLAQ